MRMQRSVPTSNINRMFFLEVATWSLVCSIVSHCQSLIAKAWAPKTGVFAKTRGVTEAPPMTANKWASGHKVPRHHGYQQQEISPVVCTSAKAKSLPQGIHCPWKAGPQLQSRNSDSQFGSPNLCCHVSRMASWGLKVFMSNASSRMPFKTLRAMVFGVLDALHSTKCTPKTFKEVPATQNLDEFDSFHV